MYLHSKLKNHKEDINIAFMNELCFIFDKLNIRLTKDELKLNGKIQASGYQTHDGKEEYEGITEDYIVTDVIENTDGTLTYVRKRIIVKNGLIVGQQVIS